MSLHEPERNLTPAEMGEPWGVEGIDFETIGLSRWENFTFEISQLPVRTAIWLLGLAIAIEGLWASDDE